MRRCSPSGRRSGGATSWERVLAIRDVLSAFIALLEIAKRGSLHVHQEGRSPD